MISSIGNVDVNSILASSKINNAGASKQSQSNEEAKKTAQDFEAFFITQMLETMFSDVKPDTMFGGGQAEKIYRSFMLDEYGKMMAKSGGIGVGDAVLKELLKTQEVTDNKGEV